MHMCDRVQCEADAVAFTEESQSGLAGPSTALPMLADGSYVLAPTAVPVGTKQLRLESCLPGPTGNLLGARTRTRVVHFLHQRSELEPWRLSKIEVPT